MKWSLLPLLLVSGSALGQDTCETPLTLPEVLGVLESSPALILGFEQSRAGDQLDVLQAKLPCLNEAMDTWMLSRMYYLRGMATLYQDDAEGREPEGSHQGAITWFVLAQASHPAMDWDLATFGPYGQADFAAARARLTYCGGQPATCFVSVVLPANHRRLMIDGRWVSEGTTSISLLPGQHLVQHPENDRWYGQWIQVPEKGGLQLTLPGPQDTDPPPEPTSAAGHLLLGGQTTLLHLPFHLVGAEGVLEWQKGPAYVVTTAGINTGPLGTCEGCDPDNSPGVFVPTSLGTGITYDTRSVHWALGATWRTTFGGQFGTRQEVLEDTAPHALSAVAVELKCGLTLGEQQVRLGAFMGVPVFIQHNSNPVWGLSLGLLHHLGGE